MARFFIDRPVFAIVIAIVIVILGGVAIPNLPVATYPELVPPVVQIVANYRGGNALDLERTVAQPIEQQLTGLDGMLYFFSRSSNDGVLTIDVTYELGTDIDLATVKTQNKVNVALPSLPPEVQRVGVTVKKVSSAFLLAIGVFANDDRYDSLFLSNYATINLVDKIGSIPGVGDTRLAATQDYGMRVWINPDKMAKLGLTATDVSRAIQSQNRQNPAGALGQPPAPMGTDFQYPVTATGRLLEPAQFSDIILRAEPDGSLLRLRDIGRVELGAQDYKSFSWLTKKPAAVIIVYLSPGANAVDTANRVITFLDDAKKNFPAGIEYKVGYDATRFVRAAITEVVETLFIAVALVIIVVFLFLQNWRATLIPLLTVPVSIIGTFALFPLLGFSINMTSLFGLVLAIGIVVDDAIVVVEAVQHKIDHGMSPREATIKAMREVSGPVVAIALILSAVFIPVAFLGGISGQIYRQFALTIAVSVLISAFSALSLSPALSVMLLRPEKTTGGALGRFFGWFNRGFDWSTGRYLAGVRTFIRRSALALVALGALFLTVGGMFRVVPAGFLPDEDQGVIFGIITAPANATIDDTIRYADAAENVFLGLPDTRFTFQITFPSNGFGGMVLKPWGIRKKPTSAYLPEVQMRLGAIPGIQMFPIMPSALPGSDNFPVSFVITSTADQDRILEFARQIFMKAMQAHIFQFGDIDTKIDQPQAQIVFDHDKVASLGLDMQKVGADLSASIGGNFVNRFNISGRSYKVIPQIKRVDRLNPEQLESIYVSGPNSQLVPLSTVASIKHTTVARSLNRMQQLNAVTISGVPAVSLDAALKFLENEAHNVLPSGYVLDYTGESRQLRTEGSKFGLVFGLAVILIFLVLAAQFNSFRDPFIILLGSVPLAIFGALLFTFLKMPFGTFFTDHFTTTLNIYSEVGLVTLVGLVSKNGILIVQFANELQREGMSKLAAVAQAARIRLRPIMMVSVATVAGHFPLTLVTGAGAAARNSIGLVLVGGMTIGTIFTLFIVPSLYMLIAKEHHEKSLAEAEEEPVEDVDLTPEYAPATR